MSLNVIIMAGGLGKRMKSSIPKVLHPVGEIPMVVRVINEALKLEPKLILLVVGKYKNIIQEVLSNFNVLDKVKFVIQEPALGTGHAIQCCQPVLRDLKPNDKILVLSGDTPLITSSLMTKMTNFKNVKLLVTKRDNPNGYGRVKLTKGIFDKIIEHKDCNLSELQIDLVNCGIYGFKNELLLKYLDKLDNNNAQKEYYLTDMIKIIKDNAKINIDICNLPENKQWELTNVNDQEQLKYVNDLLKMKSKKIIKNLTC